MTYLKRSRCFLLAMLWLPGMVKAQHANYAAAEKYDVPGLRDKVGTLTVLPFFFRNDDRFWFIYEDQNGRNYYYVDPATKKKQLLYDKKAIETALFTLRKENIDTALISFNAPFELSRKQQTVRIAFIIAEARFLRGYYYFELVKIFGEVPLVDHLMKAGNYNLPKSSLPELWTFIENDFKAAADVLLEKGEQDVGRATKGAAQAFLCKAYIFEKKWPEALAMAEEVIQSGKYDLEANYEDNWKLDHENGIESVFEIQFTPSGTDAWGDDNEGNEFVIFTRSRNNGDGWGFNCPKQSFVDRFEAGDLRRDATIIDDGEVLWPGTDDETVADNQFSSCLDLYMGQKYQIPPSEWGLQSDDPNNWIVIRYAEVLLWAAEAAAHTGGDWQTYLQQVRDRVNMGPTPVADALQAVYHEREVELGMEGQRLWDIIRQGRGEEVLGEEGYVEGVNNYLPIPQSQLNFIDN